jgi:hypothetical protein
MVEGYIEAANEQARPLTDDEKDILRDFVLSTRIALDYPKPGEPIHPSVLTSPPIFSDREWTCVRSALEQHLDDQVAFETFDPVNQDAYFENDEGNGEFDPDEGRAVRRWRDQLDNFNTAAEAIRYDPWIQNYRTGEPTWNPPRDLMKK